MKASICFIVLFAVLVLPVQGFSYETPRGAKTPQGFQVREDPQGGTGRVLTTQQVQGRTPGGANDDAGVRLVDAARTQIGKTLLYDPAYRVIAYPGGDVPQERGVCTDVVVRAMRTGLGRDLQKLVHEDMGKHFRVYPRNWGRSSPDKNIDHRRVPNLRTYFERKGWALEVTKNAGDYLPGDLVTCTVPPNLPHIMIVSDRKTLSGRPFVIHNIGAGAREEDRLFEFELTGHYRIK